MQPRAVSSHRPSTIALSAVCPCQISHPHVYNCGLFSAAFPGSPLPASFSIYTPFSHACHLLHNEPHENSDCVSFIFCCFPKIQPGSSTRKAPHKCLLNARRASRSGCEGPQEAGYQMQTVTKVPWEVEADSTDSGLSRRTSQAWASRTFSQWTEDQGPPWLQHHKSP